MKEYFYIIDELRRRHGDNCHLCGNPMRFDIPKFKCAVRVTLDHLLPKSRQGTDEISNLALAHAWCNTTRGSRRITDRLKQLIKKGFEDGLVDPFPIYRS